MSKRTMTGVAALLAATTVLGYSSAAGAGPVTYERLTNAKTEPQNWLMRGGTYDAHNSSGLNQINRTNVKDLRLVYMASLNNTAKPLANQYWSPVVEDGFMYAGNGWHQIWKFDLRDGFPQIVWYRDMEQETPHGLALGGALLGDYYYVNTGTPGRLIALDKESGETVFEVSTVIPDVLPDQGHGPPPIPFKDKILISNSRGDWGNRGYIAAYSADKGELQWRFITVPAPGEPGGETWKDGWSYEQGGGAAWNQGTVDPQANLGFWGTGNPVHMFDPEGHPGDNLYTNSTIALDLDSGKLKWYFQEVPNEFWDYDAVHQRTLIDVEIGGQMQKIVGVTSRNGFYYSNDRLTGAFMFGNPWTNVNWTAGLDPKTGKPVEYDPNLDVQSYGGHSVRHETKAMNIRPSHYGSPTFMMNTYDEGRHMLYFQSMEGAANYFNRRIADEATKTIGDGHREIYCGAPAKNQNTYEDVVRNKTNPNCVVTTGLVAGIDVTTGKVAKSVHQDIPSYSGLLGTAGDLIFHGNQNGRLVAYDKDTLEELWHYNTGTRYTGQPITYMVGDKQYVAFNVGGSAIQRDEGSHPETYLISRNSMMLFYALP